MRPVHRRVFGALASAIVAALCVYFGDLREAHAIPSFARKYQTSCQTCHTVYPVLNPFGEAFRRNGYRFPSQNKSVDGDSVRTAMLPLGQEEYKKTFPDSVWPSQITDAVPLSGYINGALAMNFPNSDAEAANGNVFTWGGVLAEFHLFAGGSFSDTVTYLVQATYETDLGSPPGTFDIETGYLLWNDIVGPPHAINLWVGRLFAPQLTSFGLHSDYLSDTRLPGISIVGLYNSTGSFTAGQGHTDGAELNGILGHRFGWSLGWVASSAASGLGLPNAEDAYAHIGIKSGGVALDGEGKYGPNVPDSTKPWAEKAITIDAFGYHGLNVLDNGTGTIAGGTPAPVGQDDRFNVLGATIRAQLDSLVLDSGAQVEVHGRPYPGTPATVVTGQTVAGTADRTSATGVVEWNELAYVVFPWFVPAVRTEFTWATTEPGHANLLRVIPGVAMLVRPNIRAVVTADFERAYGVPATGSWIPAGGFAVAPGPGRASNLQAEQINASLGVAF
jgi:hypothetical protein